ncbi:unnamed protein product, partial [Meganyctiphanes norvegica]
PTVDMVPCVISASGAVQAPTAVLNVGSVAFRFIPTVALLVVMVVATGVQGSTWLPQGQQQRPQEGVLVKGVPSTPRYLDLVSFLGDQNAAASVLNAPQDQRMPIKKTPRLQTQVWSNYRRAMLERNYLEEEAEKLLTEDQVEVNSHKEYSYAPRLLATTSQLLQEGVNCSAIRSSLHMNLVQQDYQLLPTWVHETEDIGDCPTQYVARRLPAEYAPKEILEARCRCEGSQCSRLGHQCVLLTRNIPVWVRRWGEHYHVLDLEKVGVACACLRRPSKQADVIYGPFIES